MGSTTLETLFRYLSNCLQDRQRSKQPNPIRPIILQGVFIFLIVFYHIKSFGVIKGTIAPVKGISYDKRLRKLYMDTVYARSTAMNDLETTITRTRTTRKLYFVKRFILILFYYYYYLKACIPSFLPAIRFSIYEH